MIFTDIIESQDAFESVGTADVDAEKGVARGVKLLGLRSSNKRNYDTPGVRSTAIQRLRGSRVYINHPEKPTDSRKYHDKFGVVGNDVEYRPGKGFFGSVHFNPKHPSASQFVWDIENAPKTMGMSVNASISSNKPEKAGLDADVTAIEEIRSVDVVTKPATADGIFEEHVEEETMALTLDELKKNHPELVKSIVEEQTSNVAEQEELAKAKKEAADLKSRLDALESANAAEKLKAGVSTEFAKIFESVEIEEALMTQIVECACEMNVPQRKKFSDVLSGLTPMFIEIPDEDEEDPIIDPVKEEVEEDEKPSKTYRPGAKKKTGGLDLRKSMGLT